MNQDSIPDDLEMRPPAWSRHDEIDAITTPGSYENRAAKALSDLEVEEDEGDDFWSTGPEPEDVVAKPGR